MDEEEFAIGIDLGTTYSCVAVLKNNKVEIIPNEIGENLTPSIVSFTDEGILVGEQTLNQLIKNPKKTIYSIKRMMGRNYNDVEVINDIKSNFWAFDVVEQESSKRPLIRIEKEKDKYDFYFPEQISKYILEKLVKSASDYLNQPITKAVITVPAYFNDAQRNATKFAAKEAGLEVLRIINEPTAASLAYGLDTKFPKNINPIDSLIIENKEKLLKTIKQKKIEEEEEKLVIVFDLGGGTFDVTLLKIEDQKEDQIEDQQQIFDIQATAGDSHLGGDDFNKKISDHCLTEFCTKFKYDKAEIEKDKKTMNRLKIASEKAKIKLSFESETNIDIDEFYKNEFLHVKLTRETFENISKDLFDKLLGPIDKVLDDARIGITDITEVVLVGGSTRIPKVKELISNYFFDININDSINPDETVAYGAAIQAAKLLKKGNEILDGFVLMDVTPFSLGIEVKNTSEDPKIAAKGNLMSVILPRGTKIPITKKESNYETSYDYQNSISINVYEGEKKYVKDNHLLGSFKLVDIPIKPKGEVNIDVTFNVDENGILIVSALETSKGITNSIKIINDKGFNEEEVIENIKNSLTLFSNEDNNKDIINYKNEMSIYYKYYIESYKNEDKFKYMRNFIEVFVNFINTFDKEGNDTLGNKYFLYIKSLFCSYRTLIQLVKILDENDKQLIIKNSKNFLRILSDFNNINYNNYIELIKFFSISLSEEEKNDSFETQTKIEELRNNILFDLAVYVMELLEEKGEKMLLNKSTYSRYNAKYLFYNCIKISELFIISERDLSKNVQIRNRHNSCIEKCKNEIKKINANSLVEIDKSKQSGKLFENTNNMNREDLLILLDNYRQALQTMEGIKNDETALIMANIVKINYKYINNQNNDEGLKKLAEQSIAIIKSKNKNIEKLPWYLEISQILQELKQRIEDKEKNEQEDFEMKYKTENKQIFDEIKKYREKSNVEFIEFILEKYPPKKTPLKEGKTVQEQWNENAKSFCEKISARYNPDNYPKNTEEEKLKFTIYHTISNEINDILSEINPHKFELDE